MNWRNWKIVRKIELFNANVVILLNRILPFNKPSKRGLIFANMGMGDLIMFMPTIKEILHLGYDVDFYVKRHPQKEILEKHFPECSTTVSGKYGWVMVNYHNIYKKEYIFKILKLRIPMRIGHKFGKWDKFFTHHASLNLEINKQVDENLNLAYQLHVPELPYSNKLFFKTEKIVLVPDMTYEDYIAIAPFCSTDKRKEIINLIPINKLSMPVILLGNDSEHADCELIRPKFNFKTYNLAGILNIFQTAYIIKNASLFISHEGGLAHIAAAVNTKSKIYYFDDISEKHAMHTHLDHMSYISLGNYYKEPQKKEKITTNLIKAKVDFDYGYQNGSRYIQVLLSFGTFFEVLKMNTGISRLWYFFIVPFGIFATWIWGKYLTKFKVREREATYIAEQNRYMMDVHKKINEKN